MSDYIVSARKYRPTNFSSVIGQGALTTTLKNAIATGKLAQAYLFCGPRGVGKTTCARIFAKTINCMNPLPDGSACEQCESCRAFNEGRSLNIYELDAASNNSVDDIRQLVEQVRIPPQIGKYKVYIIDEVHMLSSAAFNAFLKTLEEPPRHAIFILATTEKQKILPTILSRCQIYDFQRISVEDMVKHLEEVADNEGVKYEPEALNVIAQKADGGMRDALSIFDQAVSFSRGNLTYKSVIDNLNVLDYEYYFRLTDYLLQEDVTDSLLLLNDVLNKGFDAGNFINGYGSHLRDLLVSKDPKTVQLLEVSSSTRDRYVEQAKSCPTSFLFKAMKVCCDCGLNYRNSRNKRFLVECTLIQLAQLDYPEKKNSSGSNAAAEAPALKPIKNSNTAIGKAESTESATANRRDESAKPQVSATQTTASQIENHSAATQHPKYSEPPADNAPTQAHDITSLFAKKSQAASNVKVVSAKDLRTRTTGEPAKAATDKQPSQAATVARQPQPEPPADKPLTTDSVRSSWIEYAQQLPKEQIALTKRMQTMQLNLGNDGTVDVLVDNELAAKEFNALRPEIQAFMQQRSGNSKLKLNIKIAVTEKSGKALSRAEQYQKMAEKNSKLLKFKKDLDLDLN